MQSNLFKTILCFFQEQYYKSSHKKVSLYRYSLVKAYYINYVLKLITITLKMMWVMVSKVMTDLKMAKKCPNDKI